MKLHEKLEAVVDESTFLAFAIALLHDRTADVAGKNDAFGRGEVGWENHSIENFLEAAIAWAEASKIGATQGLANATPWKRFATFLYCGKIYE